MSSPRLLKLIAGPLAAILIWTFCDLDPGNPLATRMAGIIAWVAIWWLTEALNLGVTALLPLVLMPVFGIADMKTTSMQYMDQVIFLFIGGFLLAIAMEKWNLHKRIALNILLRVGSHPSQILFGVMLTAFLISMWISNTATTMMLFPAVLSIAASVKTNHKHYEKFAAALMIGLAYAATIGGMSTLVGTPTNMIFASFYSKEFPGQEISFTDWFAFGFPFAFTFFLIAFFVLKFMFIRKSTETAFSKNEITKELVALGKTTGEEKIIMTVFFCTALLWFFRAEIDFGFMKIKGWSDFFGKPGYLQDSTVAVFMALILFLIPSSIKKENLMEWKDVSRLPLHIIFLFGGGFAIAKGFEASGLTTWLAENLSLFHGTNKILIVIVICLVVTFLSELTSNVATIQLMLPVLFSLSVSLQLPPLLLMIPATLAASSGFMLHVATAPNTIAYSSGLIETQHLLKAGAILDIVFILIITIAMMFY
jgi:solute carrier family 13 (sodium-dependent dicarboxylate transporter), member 2/3/5